MMVIFTSMSEKKAIPNVRRILDMFADRIGHDTWKTVITQEGLSTVHTLLRHSATKNTAVACHWIRSRSRSDLLWIVGNKKQFNEFGCVPVHRTSKHIAYAESDQQWQFLPQLKAFVALGALFHDLGKATKLFSDKLRGKNAFGKDPYRHEWVSCKIIEAIVEKTESRNDDSLWLQALADGKITDQDIKSTIKTLSRDTFGKLPPIAAQLVWVILSHHRLPSLSRNMQSGIIRQICLHFILCVLLFLQNGDMQMNLGQIKMQNHALLFQRDFFLILEKNGIRK